MPAERPTSSKSSPMTGRLEKLSRSVYAARLSEFADVAFAGLAAAAGHRGKWEAFFVERMGAQFDGRIILEIGCFDAAYLTSIAAAHPNTAFVGIDWKCRAIYDGAQRVAANGVANVVLLRVRGNDLLHLFAEAELDEIWVFHPDPCARDHERKNRLIGLSFLYATGVVLKDRSSILAIKTDHREYFQSVLELFSHGSSAANPLPDATQHPLQLAMHSTDYWHDPIAISHTRSRAFATRPTLFESRFMKKGMPIFFIEMRK
jgi:tRNA G46 methylase TrmB